MKILAIRGKNLASVAGEFEIDFTSEPLKSAGIFAICGATGAGKSTLLDALCLALFNNTPRTTGTENIKMADVGKEQIQQGDKRQILRRGTTDGYAEVDFLAINGKSYRAHWHIRRANNRISGKLQPVDWRVYCLDNQQEITSKISESENKLEELTGLTYEQFTRTVLLAQNEFARFLKARKEEKAEVLEKLTGTEIYSVVSNIVFTKNADAKAAWKLTHERLAGIHLLTKDEISSLTEQQKQLRQSYSTTKQEQEKTTRQIEWLTTYERLQQEKAEAKEILVLANQAMEKARPQIERLKQIESIKSASPFFHNLQKYTEDIEREKKLLSECKVSLSGFEHQSRQLAQKVNLAHTILQQSQTVYQDIQPELQKARELDIRIDQEENNRKENAQSLQLATRKRTAGETELTQKEIQLTDIQNRQKALAFWFEKHNKHEQMCSNMNLITGFLDSANNASEQKQHREKRLRELILQKDELLSKQENFQKQQDIQKDSCDKKNKEKQQLQAQINAIDILEIRKDRKQLLVRRDHIKETQNTLKEILSLQDTLEQKEKQYQTQRKQRDDWEQQMQQIKTEYQKVIIQRDTSRQIYEKAQQSANADIMVLRRQLIPDTPCPVCGSCQHPLVSHPFPESPAIDLLKTEYEKYEIQCGELQNEIIRLSQDIRHADQVLLSLENERNICHKQCEECVQNWRKQNSHYSAQQKLDSAIIGQLSKELTEVEEKLNKLDRQETTYEHTHSILSRLIDLIEKEQQTTRQLEEQFSKAKERTDKISTEISKEKAVCENLQIQIENALAKLDGVISIDNWHARWTTDRTRFRQELSDATVKWEAKRQEQESLQTTTVQQQAEIKKVRHALNMLIEQEKEALALQEKRTETINKLCKERNGLLEGKPVAEIERMHQQKIKKQTEETELLGFQKQETDSKLEQLRGKTKQLAENIENLKVQLTTNRKQLSDWLEHYNKTVTTPLTEKDLTELLSVGTEELQNIKKTTDELQHRFTVAATTFAEREKQIRQHFSQDTKPEAGERLDTLKEKDIQLKQQLEVRQHELTEISVILRNQEQNSLQAGELKQVLEQQTGIMEEWDKLDDLIGSQSGNKFKEIAQGYTLDILLNYANKQLKELTPRYRLQRVPGELALQIVDHDMCDEVRSVFSLSGGESFLISLALALGLSSFSSHNHHEENLFIDEGFGTLDTDTLQVVMEALERLRSQGRKVGVISHVQEMAERIPVQICVHKIGNGKSKIKIIS